MWASENNLNASFPVSAAHGLFKREVEAKQVRGRFIMPEGPSKSNAENMKSSDRERACLNYAGKMRYF